MGRLCSRWQIVQCSSSESVESVVPYALHGFFLLLAAASELDRHLQALLKDLVMTQPEVVIPEIQLHCKELMVNFNRFVLLLF